MNPNPDEKQAEELREQYESETPEEGRGIIHYSNWLVEKCARLTRENGELREAIVRYERATERIVKEADIVGTDYERAGMSRAYCIIVAELADNTQL